MAKPISLGALSRSLARWVPGLDGTTAAGVPCEAAFDPDPLRALFGDAPAQLAVMISAFAEAAAKDLAALGTAATNAGLATAAHRLKGAARVIGARALADMAEQVEAAARLGDSTAARAAVTHLPALLAEAEAAARASLEHGPTA